MNNILSQLGPSPVIGTKLFWSEAEEHVSPISPTSDALIPGAVIIAFGDPSVSDRPIAIVGHAMNKTGVLIHGSRTIGFIEANNVVQGVAHNVRGDNYYTPSGQSYLVFSRFDPLPFEVLGIGTSNVFVGSHFFRGQAIDSSNFATENGYKISRYPDIDSANSSVYDISKIELDLRCDLQTADIAEVDKQRAEVAISEALNYAKFFPPAISHPEVTISDEGFVSFNWRGKESGVLLNFFGDGTVSASIKKPGQFYGTNEITINIEQPLANDVIEALFVTERAL